MATSDPYYGTPPCVAYVFQTGASSADKTPFQQLVTLDAPATEMLAAVNGRQGPYFLGRIQDYGLENITVTYVLPTPGGTTDVPYEHAPKQTYVWRSKKYVMPGVTTWSCAKVVHKCGCVRLRLYIDGCLIYDRPVRGSKPFRLPSQLAGTTLEIELIGTAEVDEVHVASSMKELTLNG